MTLSITQWKEYTESTIRRGVQNHLNLAIPEIATSVETHLKTSSFAALGKQVGVTFAADDKIQQYLDGVLLPTCCLVCVEVGPFKQCAVPHNGPCNMC